MEPNSRVLLGAEAMALILGCGGEPRDTLTIQNCPPPFLESKLVLLDCIFNFFFF